MKSLNPLQMRRAVKDYRFEVNEGRMTDECSQYLAQLQKDWERQRIKLGVEMARKEVRIEQHVWRLVILNALIPPSEAAGTR